MNLDVLLNNLLTSGMALSDPEVIRKIKILNIFQLICIMIAPLIGLFYFYISAILLFYAVIIAGLLMVFSLLLLRKTKNVLIAGNVAVFILWAVLSFISWNTGAITYEGVIKPSWILHAGLILFAIFLNGYLWGTVWTIVVFLEIGLVVYLFRSGYLFPNLIPPEITAVYNLGIYLMGLLSILLFAFLFEKEKIEAFLRERVKSRALRESKKYIEDILGRSPVPTFILDSSHRVIQWNSACREITGVSAEEALGKHVWKGLHLDSRGSLADIILDEPDSFPEGCGDTFVSRTDNGWFEMETVLPNFDDGVRAKVTVSPILDNSGTIRGAIQTIQELKIPKVDNGDVGEMGTMISFPVFRVTEEGNITYWNQACESIFGYASSSVLGKSALSLVSKGSQNAMQDMIDRVFSGEALADISLKFTKRDGQPVYVLVKAYAEASGTGEGKDCVIINTNITDLRVKSKQLELYALETKEKLKNLSEEYDLLKRNIATFIRKDDDLPKEGEP